MCTIVVFKIVDWRGIEPLTSALRMQRYTTKPPALSSAQTPLYFYQFENHYLAAWVFYIVEPKGFGSA